MKREERLNDFEESLRLALDGRQSTIWSAIPAIVLSVDLESQTLEIQPAIQGIEYDKDGNANNKNLPVLSNVPIVWPRSGGFSLTFPIKSNDEVLVVFSSRCIDAWWESGGVSAQSEQRMHDLSDAFAILSPCSQPNKISNVSSENVQLRSDSGTSYVEISPSGSVNIVAQSSVNVQTSGDAKVQGTNVEINADTTATITAPAIVLNGTVTGGQGGGMSLGPGGITSSSGGSVTIDGKPYETHKHSGVQSGGSITGPIV